MEGNNMKKICIVCGNGFNDWFMNFLGFIFRDKYDFKTCQSCRDLSVMGMNVEEIRDLNACKE